MNSFQLVLLFGCAAFLVEIVFVLYCYQWLSKGKRTREREFARLDSERAELLELQSALASEMREAKALGEETVKKLRSIGADAHAEWTEMLQKLDVVMGNVEGRAKKLVDEKMGILGKQRLTLDKSSQQAEEANDQLIDTLEKAERLLRFFDQSMPAEEVVKELQSEKYALARTLLLSGQDASVVSRKLGLSQSEVALISHMR